MKGLNIFLAGLAAGAIAGLLFAPEKGCDLRDRIKSLLKRHGVIPQNEIDVLIDQLSAEQGFDPAQRAEDTDKE